MKKPVTITAHNKTFIHEDSRFIIHTATSCHVIEEVFCEFKYKKFEQGMELAERIKDAINDFHFPPPEESEEDKKYTVCPICENEIEIR